MSSCFNPHPARELDATWPGEDFAIVEHRFNPHPARELDATRCAPCQRIPQIVSTLIQPESWMLLGYESLQLHFFKSMVASAPIGSSTMKRKKRRVYRVVKRA